ncbi:MAG: tetratricopeptide repeat protein [Desulfatitalea sp.]|nr:tetratricopeptide repeat protein [Desulfatitalea sp.]NNK02023.1 tetratricopeptide repeat protein [Desulfatitalea sp.]
MPFRHVEEHTGSRSFLHAKPDCASADRTNPSGHDTAQFPYRTSMPAEPFAPPPEVAETILEHVTPWPQFSAWAIRVDKSTGTEHAGLHAAICNCLRLHAEAGEGIWFHWKDWLYACILPTTTPSAESAQRFQADLAEQRAETVSIGVTHFPLLEFDPAQTLLNSWKALNHAAFFGSGCIVAFDAVSLNISADNHYQVGRVAEAVTEYRLALDLDPTNVNVLNSLGVCLAETGDRVNAAEVFQQVLAIDPNEAMALYNLGILRLMDGDEQQALSLFQQAYATDSEWFEIPLQIGKLLTERKAYADAIPLLEAAIALRGDFSPVHSMLGRCLACTGKSQEAIAAYKRAVKINPNDAAALSALGALYDARNENRDVCFTFCRQSVALDPNNGLYRLRLARLYHKHDRLNQALAEYRRATELGCDASPQISKITSQLASHDDKTKCCTG